MYREIDLSLEDEFKLKEHVNHLVTLDKQQLIENSMESKINQLDFERIVKELLLDYGLKLFKSSTKKNGRELVTINIIPITEKIERNFELLWFYQYGASEIFPDEFEEYISVIPKEERNDLISSFYKYLTSSDANLRSKAAAAWTKWELSTSHLINKKFDFDKSEVNSFSDAFARIECHYFINNIFLEDDFILKNIKIIESIPTKIIQGRYDVVCPVRSAWDLNKKLKNSELIIVNDAGHSMSEEGITIKLVEAVKDL